MGNPNWRKGVSGNPKGRAEIDADTVGTLLADGFRVGVDIVAALVLG
jgi:hypothetical protein